MTAYPRVLPVGDTAVTVELGDAIDPATNAAVRGLDEALRADPLPGQRETVPTHRSLLVCFESAMADVRDLETELVERALRAPPSPREPRRIVIPAAYGGEEGPDLAEVARASGLSEAEVVAAHCGTEYTAFMLGFVPGFAYLGSVPAELAVPRLPTPRVRVPAGSVALAAGLTAIYPSVSAGGWRLIGRTAERLFDPFSPRPTLIEPGDRVRFERVASLPPRGAPSALPRAAAGPPGLEVLSAGVLTTVQDRGRHGIRRLGIASAGVADPFAAAAANRAVGNDDDAAVLEAALVAPTLRFLRGLAFAIAGADDGPVLVTPDQRTEAIPAGVAVAAPAGSVLRFEGRRSGCRLYLAFAGGLDVPVVLGSRSTDLVGGFGGFEGRALRRGDRLFVGEPGPRGTGRAPATRGEPAPDTTATVRVVLGPQADAFAPEAILRLIGGAFRVTSASDRVALRLTGPLLPHRGRGEIVTDGLVPGCIQVPPDGQPIVTLADGPTTGGYPKIGVVRSADLGVLAQLVPGEGEVRFKVG